MSIFNTTWTATTSSTKEIDKSEAMKNLFKIYEMMSLPILTYNRDSNEGS